MELLPGVEFDHDTSDKITKIITVLNGQLKMMFAAALDMHQTNRDPRKLHEKFGAMHVGSRRVDEKDFRLVFENLPRNATYRGNLLPYQKQRLTEIVRDVALMPKLAANPTMENVREFVRTMVERTGLFESEKTIRSFIWGGHAIPTEEAEFAEEVGYLDALAGTEFITGSGSGVMKAPFKGANMAYSQFGPDNKRQKIGFTERGILVGEAPNKLLTIFSVFPNIEWRMMAFMLASHRGRVHPGGTGTMEEIMTFLGMKIHPNNKGLVYPFDLVERPDGDYVNRIKEFFKVCFANALDGLISFHVESPEEYARHLEEVDSKLNSKNVWQDHVYIPQEICEPFEVTFASIEGLDLSREQEPFNLIVNLRRFFSAMVHLVVKNPALKESWGTDRPKIRGDIRIIQEVDKLIRWFNDNGRLRRPRLDLKDLPYRI